MPESSLAQIQLNAAGALSASGSTILARFVADRAIEIVGVVATVGTAPVTGQVTTDLQVQRNSGAGAIGTATSIYGTADPVAYVASKGATAQSGTGGQGSADTTLYARPAAEVDGAPGTILTGGVNFPPLDPNTLYLIGSEQELTGSPIAGSGTGGGYGSGLGIVAAPVTRAQNSTSAAAHAEASAIGAVAPYILSGKKESAVGSGRPGLVGRYLFPGDVLNLLVTAVGSGTAGSDLAVNVEYTEL